MVCDGADDGGVSAAKEGSEANPNRAFVPVGRVEPSKGQRRSCVLKFVEAPLVEKPLDQTSEAIIQFKSCQLVQKKCSGSRISSVDFGAVIGATDIVHL